MRDQARRRGLPENAVMVAGRAEQIPLTSGSADVVWVSAVVHHLTDLDAWAAETRRVLKPGGWLLIRGMFADLGTTSWLPELPGADRARQIFPSLGSLSNRLAPQGIELVRATEVAELHRHPTARATAEWIATMRTADSLLLAFSDDEIAQGLERLARYPDNHSLGPTRLGFALFQTIA
jgi:ubiquinone/menaquinone biosynthesis C-methylase UbiE